jgi:HAMP domain-containing protein
MEKAKESGAKQVSVVRRFNTALFAVYIAGIMLAAPTIYFITYNQVHSRAERELTTLVDMIKSIQGFVAKDLRPYFMKNKLFFSPGFSGIVATSRIASQFKNSQPDYYIKNASDNPLNPANSPEPLEAELLEQFRDDRSLKQLVQVGEIGDRRLLISAAPKVSKKGCLRCHGARDEVPTEISSEFTGVLGYNYRSDDVVGVSLVGVPIENVHLLAMQRTGIVVAVLTVLFGIIFVTINRLVKKLLLGPILAITHAAHEISHGKLDAAIELGRNDEIGDLARSVELVRRSFEKVMKRMRRGA